MAGLRVFDSWALLAWLLDQPAAAHIQALLQLAEDHLDSPIFMSWMNAGEVYYMVSRKVGQKAAEDFLNRLPSLPIRLVVPEPQDFISAAKLKATRRISYADGFASALTIEKGGRLVTGDPELAAMADVVSIEWIGKPLAALPELGSPQ
jgi:predicted nucleic acid-binding protein